MPRPRSPHGFAAKTARVPKPYLLEGLSPGSAATSSLCNITAAPCVGHRGLVPLIVIDGCHSEQHAELSPHDWPGLEGSGMVLRAEARVIKETAV